MPADLDRLDVVEGEVASIRELGENELADRDAAVGQEVRAWIDRGRVDAEIAEHGGRGNEELRLGGVHGPGRLRAGSTEGSTRVPATGSKKAGTPGSMTL